jgi:hypothetical protein
MGIDAGNYFDHHEQQIQNDPDYKSAVQLGSLWRVMVMIMAHPDMILFNLLAQLDQNAIGASGVKETNEFAERPDIRPF